MTERGIRYELEKMGSDYDKGSGVYFVKNSNPAGRAHWHDCYEIEFIISGSADDIINDCVYKAQKGDLFFLTPNDFHELDNFKDFTCYGVMFPEELISDSLLERLEGRSLSTNIYARLSENDIKNVEVLFRIIEQEMQNKREGYGETVKNALNIIIGFIIRDGFKETNTRSKYTSVRKAVNYIKNNFDKSITLNDVAAEVNLDPKYFSVLFKRSIKISFKSFLNETRLNCAMKHLKNRDIPITEICYLCGFGSISNFNRLFKREIGISPREYRLLNSN